MWNLNTYTIFRILHGSEYTTFVNNLYVDCFNNDRTAGKNDIYQAYIHVFVIIQE